MLIQESMIETVIDARDRYLAKDGIILPDKANLYICGIEDADYKEQRIDFWDNVYGFNMSCMKEGSLTEPLIDMCQPQQVITSCARIYSLDLSTATKDCMKITAPFTIKSQSHDFCHALVLHFDVSFSKALTPVHFSTGPQVQYTHWKQSVFYLDEPIPFHVHEDLSGTISMHVEGEKKEKTIVKIESKFKGKAQSLVQSRTYKYG